MRRILALALMFLLGACASFREESKEQAELHLQIGTSHFQNGNYPYALQELLEGEKLDPSNALIQNNLGLVYFMRERIDLAEKHLRRAIELNPKYSDARNNLARVLIEKNLHTEAEALLQIVLADLTYAGADRAYVNLGLSQFNRKDYVAARSSFAKALETARANCLANSYYGRSLFELEDYQKASEALDRAVGFCQRQGFDEPHYYSALAWYRLGDKGRAMARFEEIVKLYPEGKNRDKSRAMLDLLRKGTE